LFGWVMEPCSFARRAISKSPPVVRVKTTIRKTRAQEDRLYLSVLSTLWCVFPFWVTPAWQNGAKVIPPSRPTNRSLPRAARWRRISLTERRPE
jgi:hypothetical protein